MKKSAYFGSRTSEYQQTRTNFPLTKTALWDKRPTGADSEISFCQFRDVSLHLVERSLRLAYNATAQKKQSYHRGFFLGSLSTEDDEIRITLNRFDAGHGSGTEKPVSPLPGDVIVPLIMCRRGSAFDDCSPVSEELISSAVRDLEKASKSIEPINILKLFRLICVCQFSDQYGELCFEFSWTLLAPSVPVLLRPVAPVSVIPTALARNLSGPLSLSSLQNSPKHGFLTMDQTRKLLLLLESDPKVAGLPLIGVWVSGVMSSSDIHLWASLTRFLRCTDLREKQTDGETGFLAMLYLPTEKQPCFFDCYSSDPGYPYCVLTSQEELNLFKKEDKNTDSTFIHFSLGQVDSSPVHGVIDVALRTLQCRSDAETPSPKQPSELDLSREIEENVPLPCPQFTPSSHLPVSGQVPDVSVWEDRENVPVLNRSDSCEQDAGFYSKSSSDHDTSTDRHPVYPSRKSNNAPMETIESSTNMTPSSSVKAHSRHVSGDTRGNPRLSSSNQNDSFGSPGSMMAPSECHSCRSDKAELVSNLAEQKKQLELLQSQIQALLRSQNVPDSPRNVLTRSAQTSPNLSMQESHDENGISLPRDVNNFETPYCVSDAGSSSARKSETLVSINPDSVSIQEDANSSGDMIITHIDMPSFVDSSFSGTQGSLRFGESVSVLMENSMSESQQASIHQVRCLNASQISHRSEKGAQPQNQQLQIFAKQIAAVLNNSYPGANDAETEKRATECSFRSQKCKSRRKDKSHVSVNFNPETSHISILSNSQRHNEAPMSAENRSIDFSISDKSSSVDVSLEANAIAMKYGGSATQDSFMAGYSKDESELESWLPPQCHKPIGDISLATAKYFERHGLARNGPATTEAVISEEEDECSNFLPSYLPAPESRKFLEPEPYVSPVSRPLGTARSSDSSQSGSQENIFLDMSKLRSLPKLL